MVEVRKGIISVPTNNNILLHQESNMCTNCELLIYKPKIVYPHIRYTKFFIPMSSENIKIHDKRVLHFVLLRIPHSVISTWLDQPRLGETSSQRVSNVYLGVKVLFSFYLCFYEFRVILRNCVCCHLSTANIWYFTSHYSTIDSTSCYFFFV